MESFQRGARLRARLGLLLAACVAWQLASAPSSRAQEGEPPEYRALIRQGVQEFDRGNWAEAYAAFSRAHAIFPNARTHRSLGVAAFEARQYVVALEHLRAALAETRRPLTPEQRQEVESFLARADGYVARITLSATPQQATVSVDAQAPVPSADIHELPFNPGVHELLFAAQGYESERVRFEVGAGEKREVAVTLRAQGAQAAAPVDPVAPTQVAPASRSESPSRVGPIIVLSAGGALLIGAALTGALAQSAESELEDKCKQNVCDPGLESTKDRGEALQGATYLLLGVGAATVIAGGVYWFLQPSDGPSEPQNAALGCGPTGCAVTYGGRF